MKFGISKKEEKQNQIVEYTFPEKKLFENKKCFFIAGTSMTGKTTFVKAMNKKYGYPILPLDEFKYSRALDEQYGKNIFSRTKIEKYLIENKDKNVFLAEFPLSEVTCKTFLKTFFNENNIIICYLLITDDVYRERIIERRKNSKSTKPLEEIINFYMKDFHTRTRKYINKKKAQIIFSTEEEFLEKIKEYL